MQETDILLWDALNTVKERTETQPRLPKRARTTDHNSVVKQVSAPKEVFEILDSSSEEEESDHDCWDLSLVYEDDIDLGVDGWPIPRVEVHIPKLRKVSYTGYRIT